MALPSITSPFILLNINRAIDTSSFVTRISLPTFLHLLQFFFFFAPLFVLLCYYRPETEELQKGSYLRLWDPLCGAQAEELRTVRAEQRRQTGRGDAAGGWGVGGVRRGRVVLVLERTAPVRASIKTQDI